MNGASWASFQAAAEPGDPPDAADLLAEQRRHSLRLTCCGRYVRHATLRDVTRYPGEVVLVGDCPTHGPGRDVMGALS